MPNDASRGARWAKFIVERCDYPAPSRLRAQFAAAAFAEFCQCGCNSFGVQVPSDANVEPLTPPSGNGGAVFEAEFELDHGRTLEIILFADARGNLSCVEIDYCGNTYPVPDEIEIPEGPSRTRASAGLIEP